MRNQPRMSQASSVLGAVRARQSDLQQAEHAIADLTRLFQSLEVLVISDEGKASHVNQQAEHGTQDLERANEEIKFTTKIALHRQKMKWLLLGVVILIILALTGLGTGLYYALKDKF